MKWSIKQKNVIVYIISLLLCILFMYAGLTKVWEGDLFYHNIIDSPVFGGETIALIASWAVPFLEILTALLLVWQRARLIGLYMALCLLMAYTMYIIANLFFSPSIPCTCRTFFSIFDWHGHLYFTVTCLLVVIITIGLYPKRKLRTNTYKTHFAAQQKQE